MFKIYANYAPRISHYAPEICIMLLFWSIMFSPLDLHLVKDIAALESVQRFATKVCTKACREDVDYDEWLCTLNLPTLKARQYSLKLASYTNS